MNAPATTPEALKSADSALAKYLSTVKGEKINASDKKAAGAKFKQAILKRQELEKQLEALDTENEAVTREAIRCFGRAKLTVNGVDYAPSSRDERIFYKKMSGGSVEL